MNNCFPASSKVILEMINCSVDDAQSLLLGLLLIIIILIISDSSSSACIDTLRTLMTLLDDFVDRPIITAVSTCVL